MKFKELKELKEKFSGVKAEASSSHESFSGVKAGASFSNGPTLEVDTHWYEDAEVSSILEHYHRHPNSKDVFELGTASIGFEKTLQVQLGKVVEGKNFLVLNVSAANGSFDSNTHWVALMVERKGKENKLTLIDPMGRNEVYEGVKNSLERVLDKSIKLNRVFNEENHPQYNSNDCGPFVVEACRILANNGDVKEMYRYDKKTSDQYGQELRQTHKNILHPRSSLGMK